MRISRAIWLCLVTSAYVMAAGSIALGIWALSCNEWMRYEVVRAAIPAAKALSLNYNSRSRGLWRQCPTMTNSTVQCENLERVYDGKTYNGAETILSLRIAQPTMQVTAHGITLSTVICMAISLIVMVHQTANLHSRCGQYTVLVGGSFLWAAGLLHFASMIVHHITLDMEAYLPAARILTSTLPNWLDIANDTIIWVGVHYIVSWVSCGLTLLASWLLLLAAYVQAPPFVLLPGLGVNLSTAYLSGVGTGYGLDEPMDTKLALSHSPNSGEVLNLRRFEHIDQYQPFTRT